MADENLPGPVYAERMFPAPVDLGIAEADRAVSSVPFGTSTYLEGRKGQGSGWYEGGGAVGERAVQGITIYPPTRGVATQGDPFEPVKIGILVDMDLGQLLADWIDPTILAIEDALNEGIFSRGPIQLVIADARGLPRENYRKVIDGYRWLVEQGCVVVLGPLISDNSLVLQDTANELGVACVGWTGAHKFASEYCFTVANGDIPTEGVMCAQWMANKGFKKVGMFWEQGSSGKDYADYFRDTALQMGLEVVREVKLEPNPQGLVDDLRIMRDLGVETIYYGGYGYASFHFAAALKELELGSASSDGHRLHVLFELERVGGGPRGVAWRRPAGRGRRQPQLQRHGRAVREALRPVDTQRRGGPGLRHRSRRHPRHRQRGHPAPTLGEGGHGAHPVDAGHQRRSGHLHPVRTPRPQGLQGRLPHHPRAAGR